MSNLLEFYLLKDISKIKSRVVLCSKPKPRNYRTILFDFRIEASLGFCHSTLVVS